MTRYVTFAVAVRIIDAERIGPIRDSGLLQSALERPATTVFGRDAYPSIEEKAAALMHSVCANRALSDGNKRLAAILMLVFRDLNGYRTTLDNDGLFDLTMAIADGTLDEVADIAARLPLASRG
ncbi:type II toxin-antitoxin system death-on-curing family toxin [Demequina subtropica]|uniref:type II toxin-antitoxin system death-on-curing family toxin n=1 Tax=Demequina subtropica TaxID=1638989 RepID=UPI0007845433|nr:Fic family protein [Demequina subtropica]